jgi:hypothetical protein
MKVRIPIFVIINNFKNFKALHAYEPTTMTTSNRTDPTAEKTFLFLVALYVLRILFLERYHFKARGAATVKYIVC